MTAETKGPKRRITPPNQSRSTHTAIERRERDAQCVNLRRAGLGWDAIAKQLGYTSAARAYEQFMSFMKEYPREDAVAARELEADRYDQLQRAIWAKCLKGDTWAIDRALKLMDQRARLLGLNMPVRAQIEVITESTVDTAIAALTAQLEAQAVEVADAEHAAGGGAAGQAATAERATPAAH